MVLQSSLYVEEDSEYSNVGFVDVSKVFTGHDESFFGTEPFDRLYCNTTTSIFFIEIETIEVVLLTFF